MFAFETKITSECESWFQRQTSFQKYVTAPSLLLPVVGHHRHIGLPSLLLSPLAPGGNRIHLGVGDLRSAGWQGCHKSPGGPG